MFRNAALIASFSLVLTAAVYAEQTPSAAISGQYVEIRSSDVYTGPCFANGEMGLVGEEAVLTWSITQGAWEGVDLQDLKVIAVVKASATLGDTSRSPYPAKAVLIVDRRADEAQRTALIAFARSMAGKLLENIVRVDRSDIAVSVMPSSCATNGCASVEAEGLVNIKTRCLNDGDHVCGNEEPYFPPLSLTDGVRPAFTEIGQFSGKGLGITFDEGGRRSAFLGTFTR